MIYVFIHQNFPGQYKHLVRHLADQPGNTVYFITQPNQNRMRAVTKLVYQPSPSGQLNCHPYTFDFDLAVRNGLAVAGVCRGLRDQGIRPDIIVGHLGWGETLFIKEVFPEVPLLAYFEFFYHYSYADVGFDPEFAAHVGDPFRLRTKNLVNFLAFDAADWGNSPTQWQWSTYAPEMRPRIAVLHEGVDTEIVRPSETSWLRLARGELTGRDEVITYVARNLEPYRGFHIFMRAVVEIMRRRPRAHIVIVGGDEVSYGMPAPGGGTYRQMMLRELGPALDFSRIHFLGQIPYQHYLSVLQISSAHIYLTYPFVLSWLFIEALASGCAIIGSDTPPVLEVLRDRVNGLVVDFFSAQEIADRVDEILDHPDRMQAMRLAARRTAVEAYDFKSHLLPQWMGLMDDLMHGRRPLPFASEAAAPRPRRAARPAKPRAVRSTGRG